MNKTKNLEELFIPLDALLKVKMENNVITYANNAFFDFTQRKFMEVITKDFKTIFHSSNPQAMIDYFFKEENNLAILKLRVNYNDYVWGLFKKEGKDILIKYLPSHKKEELSKLFSILNNLEAKNFLDNEVSKRYLGGFLEEKNLSFQEYILYILGIREKKLKKYFEINSI